MSGEATTVQGRACPVCGGPVEGPPDKVYCSRRCRDVKHRPARREQSRAYREKYPEKAQSSQQKYRAKLQAERTAAGLHPRKTTVITCAVCGMAAAGRADKRYCSQRCALKAYYRAHPERYREWRRRTRAKRRVGLKELQRAAAEQRRRCPPECPTCGNPVQGAANRRYCSDPCQRQAAARRYRENHPAAARERYARNRQKCLEQKRKYYEQHGEEVRERHRGYYRKHREECVEADRQYREKNREKVRERQRKYTDANRERICARGREYWQNNREELRKRKRDHYRQNRERLLEENRQWREANAEKCREYARNRYWENRDQKREEAYRWREQHRAELRERARLYRLERNTAKIASEIMSASRLLEEKLSCKT